MEDINKNIEKIELFFRKTKLIENKKQLTDSKKINFGFNLNESVIDVEQDGYSICYSDDVLYTYGIEPCCGIVICDENVRILFHVDGTVIPEEILKITNEINLSQNTTVVVIPGVTCGISGTFDYKKLEEDYEKKGYKVTEQRIPATLGFVALDANKITIGTALSRDLDVVLSIPKRNTSKKEYDNYTKDELINLKQELLYKIEIEQNIDKKR